MPEEQKAEIIDSFKIVAEQRKKLGGPSRSTCCILNSHATAGAGYIGAMGAILFTCPTTQFKVQHWLDDDETASEDDYEGITCQACACVHFVNRNGKVLGGDDE